MNTRKNEFVVEFFLGLTFVLFLLLGFLFPQNYEPLGRCLIPNKKVSASDSHWSKECTENLLKNLAIAALLSAPVTFAVFKLKEKI